jgi:molybdopterin converting factor small subunit
LPLTKAGLFELKAAVAVRVEFYGIPRQRAGVATASVVGTRLGELIQELARQFPLFARDCVVEDCLADSCLQPGYTANLNGERFTSDPATVVCDNDVVLIMSLDAGG